MPQQVQPTVPANNPTPLPTPALAAIVGRTPFVSIAAASPCGFRSSSCSVVNPLTWVRRFLVALVRAGQRCVCRGLLVRPRRAAVAVLVASYFGRRASPGYRDRWSFRVRLPWPGWTCRSSAAEAVVAWQAYRGARGVRSLADPRSAILFLLLVPGAVALLFAAVRASLCLGLAARPEACFRHPVSAITGWAGHWPWHRWRRRC